MAKTRTTPNHEKRESTSERAKLQRDAIDFIVLGSRKRCDRCGAADVDGKVLAGCPILATFLFLWLGWDSTNQTQPALYQGMSLFVPQPPTHFSETKPTAMPRPIPEAPPIVQLTKGKCHNEPTYRYQICSIEASATIIATFAQAAMIYVLIYGREHVGRTESDSLRDRTGWPDPASSLLLASML